jgi:hypothetical protein
MLGILTNSYVKIWEINLIFKYTWEYLSYDTAQMPYKDIKFMKHIIRNEKAKIIWVDSDQLFVTHIVETDPWTYQTWDQVP